jgi:hypothetical protein
MGGDTIRKLVLYERNFGWMDVWKLNSEGLVLLWLMAYVTWGGESFWLKATMIAKRGPCPF